MVEPLEDTHTNLYWASGWPDQETVIRPIPFSRFDNFIHMMTKKKRLKVKWVHEEFVEIVEEDQPKLPTRDPDFVHKGLVFWWNEMRFAEAPVVNGMRTIRNKCCHMDLCTRTSLLMGLIKLNTKVGWVSFDQDVQNAYNKYVAEHYLLGGV